MTKKFLFALLFVTRVTRFVAWLNRKKTTILCYHSVTCRPEPHPNDPHKMHLPARSFVDHLNYLERHYRIISLGDYVKARREKTKLPSNTAILTFDDGKRNFFSVVAPMLLERGVPATSFIVTGENFTKNTSARNGSWTLVDDNSYLSWDEVKQLAAKGLEFGSHTSSHPPLPDVSTGEVQDELTKSLEALKVQIGHNQFALAYPFGRATDEIVRLSREVGYSCALTTVLGLNNADCDLFALRRVVIASDDNLPTFAARASGLTSWYSRLADILLNRSAEPSEFSPIPYEPRLADKRATHETY